MKKIFVKVTLFLMLMITFVTPSFADELKSERFMADDNVNFKGNVTGSIALAGNNVTANGNTDGIGFVAGNVIDMKGKYEYLVAAGNTIAVSANIEKEIYIAGSAISLNEGTTIGRDTFIIGTTVTLNGTYSGDVYISGTTVNAENATFNGNVRISAATITLGKGVTVAGELKYAEDTLFESDETNTISKIITYEVDDIEDLEKRTFADTLESTLYTFIGKAVVAIAIFILIPFIYKRVKKNNNFSFDNYASLFGKGFLYIILIPFISIFLMISVIGLPLSIVLLCLYGVSIYIASIFSVYAITDYILDKKLKKELPAYLVVTIGLLCYYIIKILPVIGSIVGMLIFFIGLGMLVDVLLKLRK